MILGYTVSGQWPDRFFPSFSGGVNKNGIRSLSGGAYNFQSISATRRKESGGRSQSDNSTGLGSQNYSFLTGKDPGKAKSKNATASFTDSYELLDRPPENIFTAALIGACTSKPIAGTH